MLDSGYTNITNIDASSVCIKKMQELYNDKPNLKYILMNVCDMREFTNEEFDLIIDKACLDSIVVITRASYIYVFIKHYSHF
ncbi:hypothetical protein PFFCH_05325 [Plasmodium falciparum FCH/4]|uniref:Methyltransferase type 11 domain-containing protein n=1 Tax=Plasmodium falciparum FCH/4 TaxID=1036724 RepID=A0A024VG44_PLAFA|nr:hypothetical protein PFFCH_05325 [Plasmodium falciparum FCH/4]